MNSRNQENTSPMDIEVENKFLKIDLKKNIHCIMESWLVDVKRVRIPRPKFGSSRCYPAEPPKDYFYEDSRPEDLKMKAALQNTSLSKATEELRRALQEKL
ncbi:hypothetical protein HHI36_005146 [Cryptolaemus montrouzieri]|uniref:Uncharacterized protein n=1 Tax=Cryptolaemus montrouzieri TaxID=559131 RepID=A0ABD2NT99_9CUCU